MEVLAECLFEHVRQRFNFQEHDMIVLLKPDLVSFISSFCLVSVKQTGHDCLFFFPQTLVHFWFSLIRYMIILSESAWVVGAVESSCLSAEENHQAANFPWRLNNEAVGFRQPPNLTADKQLFTAATSQGGNHSVLRNNGLNLHPN